MHGVGGWRAGIAACTPRPPQGISIITSPQQTARAGWPIIALATAAGVIAAYQIGKVAPLLPELRQALDFDLVTGGLIASVINAVGCLLGLTTGLLADRIGRRRLLLAGLVLLCLGGLAGAAAASAIWLLLSRLLEGIGVVTIVVAAPAIIAEAADPARARLALGVWATYMPTGVALAMASAPAIAHATTWRGLWLIGALAVALFTLLCVFRLPRGLGQPGRGSGLSFAAAWKGAAARPGPWLLGACFGAYALQWFAVMTWLPTLVIEATGSSAAAVGPFVALAVAVNVVGNIAGGRLLQAGFAPSTLIAVVSVALGAIGLFIMTPATDATLRLVLACLFSSVGGIIPGATFAAAPRHSPSPALMGAVNGLIVQGSNLGVLLGPPVLALMVQFGGGWQGARWVMPAAGLTGLGLALLLRRLERRI